MKTIIFDFDGVIVDSFKESFATVKHINPEATEEGYLKSYEGNPFEGTRHYSKINVKDLKEIYNEHYVKRIHKISLFKELDKVIAKLAQKYTLSIISSSSLEVIDAILKREGIRDCFKIILDGYQSHSSKIEKFKMILKELKIQAKDCLFFTDTLGDLREAAKVEIPSVAVSWGYHDNEVLARGDYRALIHEPKEIYEQVKQYFA